MLVETRATTMYNPFPILSDWSWVWTLWQIVFLCLLCLLQCLDFILALICVMSVFVRDTLSWCEHGGMEQRSLKAPASPCRQVRRFIPVLWLAVPSRPCPSRGNHSCLVWVTVAGLMVGTVVLATAVRPTPVAMMEVVTVTVVTVCSTVYLEDDGAQCDKKTNTHATEKHQSCPLWLVCERGEENYWTIQSLFVTLI